MSLAHPQLSKPSSIVVDTRSLLGAAIYRLLDPDPLNKLAAIEDWESQADFLQILEELNPSIIIIEAESSPDLPIQLLDRLDIAKVILATNNDNTLTIFEKSRARINSVEEFLSLVK